METTEQKVKKSLRLEKIVELLPSCDYLYDVGTDHGLLLIKAMNALKARRIIATDARLKPALRAQENIKNFPWRDQVEVVMTDGLQGVRKPSEKDCVVISGLGGLVIKDILEKARPLLAHLILQVQWSCYELRKWLKENDFFYIDETIVEEKGKLYVIMHFVAAERMQSLPLPDKSIKDLLVDLKAYGIEEVLALWLGPYLLAKAFKNQLDDQAKLLWKKYLKKEAQRLQNIEKSQKEFLGMAQCVEDLLLQN